MTPGEAPTDGASTDSGLTSPTYARASEKHEDNHEASTTVRTCRKILIGSSLAEGV